MDEFKIIVEDEKTVDASTAIMNDFLKGEKGDKGDTNKLTIGIVEKGEEASASIVGESPNQILNLVLPKGDKGDTGEAFTYDKFTIEQLEKLRGPQGKQGIQGEQGLTGDKGDKGDDGASGYTPIKGIDYFTDNEIAEIKNNLQEEVNTQINKINTQLTNIEQEGIIVSPTEPTENRRKVWMQKGKNLFSIGFISGYTLNSTTGNNESSSNYIVTNNFIEVKANTTYTISINSNLEMLERGPRICEYDENYNMINCLYNTGLTYTFTASNHTKYIKFSEAFYSVDNMTTNIQVMLEQSSVATDYEEYIEPKTYILNDNNVYEEFMKKEETETITNENGTAIKFPSGTMIAYTDTLDTGTYDTATSTANVTWTFPVSFKDNPFCLANPRGGNAFAYTTQVGGSNTRSVAIQTKGQNASNASSYINCSNRGLNVLAIGRWK